MSGLYLGLVLARQSSDTSVSQCIGLGALPFYLDPAPEVELSPLLEDCKVPHTLCFSHLVSCEKIPVVILGLKTWERTGGKRNFRDWG